MISISSSILEIGGIFLPFFSPRLLLMMTTILYYIMPRSRADNNSHKPFFIKTNMDILEENVIEPAQHFYKSSERLLRVCKKPDENGTHCRACVRL